MAKENRSRPVEPLSYDPELGPDNYVRLAYTLIRDCDISDGAFRLYSVLLIYCRQEATAWPGQETLAKDIGRSVRQVQYLLSQLKDIGLVDWKQNGHSSNRYHVFKAPLKGRFADTQNISPLDTQNISRLDTQLIAPESHALEQHALEQHHADAEVKTLLEQEGYSSKISEKLAKILAQNERPVDYLVGWLDYVHKDPEIKKPLGFLHTMLMENQNLPKAPLTAGERDRLAKQKMMAKLEKQFGNKKE